MATATKVLENVSCPVWHKDGGKAADYADGSGYITFDELREMTELDDNPRYGDFVLSEIEKNPLAAIVSALVSFGDNAELNGMLTGEDPATQARRAARDIVLAADRA
jgi:hypothetical protein